MYNEIYIFLLTNILYFTTIDYTNEISKLFMKECGLSHFFNRMNLYSNDKISGCVAKRLILVNLYSRRINR